MRNITVKLADKEFGQVCEVRVDDDEPIATIEDPDSLAGEQQDAGMMKWIVDCVVADANKKYTLTEDEEEIMTRKITQFFEALQPMSQQHKDQILRDMLNGCDAVQATIERRAQEDE
jgi:hypothetical protein